MKRCSGDFKDGIYGLGTAYAALGKPSEAAAMLDRAHADYRGMGHHALASFASSIMAECVVQPYQTENIAGWRHLAARAEEELARAGGAVQAAIPPRFMRVPLLLLEGGWEEAERLATTVSDEAREEDVSYRAGALAYLAALARMRGDGERARWVVQKALPVGVATEPGTVAPYRHVILLQREAAALALDTGDLRAAKEWLEAHDRWLVWSGTVVGQSEGQALWSQYHRRAGEMEQAYAHAERALAHATAPRQPLALLAAHRLLGELQTAGGDRADAEAHLRASLALAEACQAPYERALTLLALAELWAATGATDEARRLLGEVRTICEPLRARPVLARADARATARAAPAPYPASLSPREVEVLRLLALGTTNREIAAALFLSENTVRVHVRHIFEKTRTDNRTAAAAFARDYGLA